MTYQGTANGYVMWQDSIMIPTVREDGTKSWWRKSIAFEDAPNYWEYICEDGSWNVYYVKRGSNRRLAQCNIGKFSPEAIIARIHDRDISVADCNKVEERSSRAPKSEFPGIIWSRDYDGKSVFELMEHWQKMPYSHIKMVIENEGGSIDNNGIIHKGE